ncbi:MAG: DNA-directed RNA polymerase subunit omega [Candidatus Aminicenantales bacterium]
MKFPKEIDSKFRFVIIASKRAKELINGAKPKIKSKFRNLIRIAQEEIEQGVIGFNIVKSKKEELHDVEAEVFIGEELENKEGETEGEEEKVESEKDEKVSEEEEEEEEEEEVSENDLADEDEEK